MSLEEDAYGAYRVVHSFVDTWGGRGYTPGWQLIDVREYVDGIIRVHRGKPQYYGDVPAEEVALAQICANATTVLTSIALRRKAMA